MRTGARHHCCSAYLTFVSVLARPGADGRPARRMKRVAPTLPNHHEIFESAERCISFSCSSMSAACSSSDAGWPDDAINTCAVPPS